MSIITETVWVAVIRSGAAMILIDDLATAVDAASAIHQVQTHLDPTAIGVAFPVNKRVMPTFGVAP